MTCLASILIRQLTRQAAEGDSDVNGWFLEDFVRDRNARMLAEAEERRLVRGPAGRKARVSLRARAARRLFGFAMVVEREETWRAVWENLEAPRRA
jgi:hypothetical protein